jgi:two-component system sensor histidine kinase KdpD
LCVAAEQVYRKPRSGYLARGNERRRHWRLWSLDVEQERLGVIALRDAPLTATPVAQPGAVDALIAHAALALARTRLADRLRQARVGEETERLRAALLSSISHDLRTPLAAMIGAASGLRTLDRQISEADREELLDTILSEGARLDRYIQNLLDMTRLGHGGLKLARDWVAVDDLLGAVLTRLHEPLRRHRVSVTVASGLPLLHVHPALIEQALVNVIENAAKFSPPDSAIHMGARRGDGEVVLSVSDQGAGIAPAERRRVFDLFYTTAAGDRGRHGSGLGLAIANGMIAAHGGRIEIADGPDGRGTTFSLHIPLVDLPPDPDDDP